ncbi:cell wall hydrolase [Rhodoplanes azumiensis]|uniref:Cell wall hydrolase n=1 Tax=Rhodoplanes azumiensis TaxID=1897628 RepID=A0ABW5AR58_9BRAD
MGSLRRISLKHHAAVVAPFGVALLTFAAIPSSVAYQDLASLIAARAGGGGDVAREQARSPFGTFHAATFSFPRPVGTAIPEPTGYKVASLDPSFDRELLTGSVASRALFDLTEQPPALDRETVNRSRKGDRMVPRAVAEWLAREQATRAAAAPLTAPEPPAVIAVLPDATGPAEKPAPASRATVDPVVATSAKASPESSAPTPVAPTPVATAGPAAVAGAETMLGPEAFSASSMAWLGGTPEPSTRTARARRTPKVEVAVAAPAPAAPAPAATAAPAPTPAAETVAATAPAAPAVTPDAPQPAAATIAEAAAEAAPQQSFMLASAGSEIVVPRSVTPKAELAGPPAAAAVEAAPAPVPPPAPEAALTSATVAPTDDEPFHPDTAVPTLGEALSPTLMAANVYFGATPLADTTGALQPWSPDRVSLAPSPEAELAALDEITPSPETLSAAIDPDGGETVVRKGEVVIGGGHALRSPAERLGLYGGERAKAEKCLADAVYFESRGEPLRGQIAVAQVVMNRVFSGYYPADVCGVVYQNAHRHLSCQFTFACDGIKDKITEPDAWERAQRVAAETLDGKHWLPDVGKATHYHAYWVRPWWVRTMHKLDKIGVHTFYRPRKWGDGADRPAWGDASLPPPAEKISDRL